MSETRADGFQLMASPDDAVLQPPTMMGNGEESANESANTGTSEPEAARLHPGNPALADQMPPENRMSGMESHDGTGSIDQGESFRSQNVENSAQLARKSSDACSVSSSVDENIVAESSAASTVSGSVDEDRISAESLVQPMSYTEEKGEKDDPALEHGAETSSVLPGPGNPETGEDTVSFSGRSSEREMAVDRKRETEFPVAAVDDDTETVDELVSNHEEPVGFSEEVCDGKSDSESASKLKDENSAARVIGDKGLEAKGQEDEDDEDDEEKEEHSVSNGAPTVKGIDDKELEEEGQEDEDSEDDEEKDEDSVTDGASPLSAPTNSKASPGSVSDTPSLGGAGPSLPLRPAGLGRAVSSLEPAPRVAQRSSGAAPSSTSRASEDNRLNSDVSEGDKEAREKLQMIRVKFLRLAHRLGQSAHNVVVAQVLYRLGLAEQLRGGRSTSRTGAFSFERASMLAEEQEAAGQDVLDFGCTIMVLGKSGVGKSATINSIFDEVKSGTDAYSPATKKVQEITGTIHGIKLRVIDTPGLLPSFADQRHNVKVMASVKRFIKKSPPDIVLYFDRLDMQGRDYGDLPLLRTITDTFGAAVWFNAIVVLTHASSAPPDGANGVPLSYEMFVAQRSHVVQQTIRQAAGDMRLMNPVSLVENHVACRTNRAGQRVLPNGQVWKPQLLLLCFASKILAEANSLLKLQDSSPGKPFGVRPRLPPLPFLLSSLLQSRAQLRLPDEQMSDDDVSEDSDDDTDSESEEEYDDLPAFRRLTKEELRLLDDEQRKTYFDELEYRERLFMKQQWKEERLRRKEMRRRRRAAGAKEGFQHPDEGLEDESAGSAAVPVPMPDMALPPSFDSDNPSHRYRYLDTASQWLVRPVLETHGWDHDNGYDGLNVEKLFVISRRIPASVSGQITKDKKEANVQMECAASVKNGEGKVTLAGLDVQTIGKDLAYTLRSETWFSNFRRNKTTCGLAVTFFGDTVAAGMKLEDALMVGRRLKVVLNGGAITGRGDVAYGGSLEATLRDKDYPLVHNISTLGLSIMDWHGDLAIGGNLQSQFMLGKTMMIARANLNNRGAGQFIVRASSSEQLQMALIGLIPLLRTFIGSRIFHSFE